MNLTLLYRFDCCSCVFRDPLCQVWIGLFRITTDRDYDYVSLDGIR